MNKTLNNIFRLRENGTNTRTEIIAGLTTFLTMAYIIFLQPAILSTDFAGNPTGIDKGAVLLATCVVAGMASIFMGLYARYPIALAPGMGENIFFVSVIMALASSGVENAWQTALGIVFISGIVFFFLSLFRIREAIINSISHSMRNGIAVGIGLFIAFIGLKNGGVIVDKPVTFVGLSPKLLTRDTAVFLAGLITAGGLQARKVKGSILWGILAASILAMVFKKIHVDGVFGLPEIKEHCFLKMDLYGALAKNCIPFIIIFIFMDMFDTVGTLVGVAEQAGLMKDNKLPRASEALLVDATATVAGACMGTSTVTSYIESAAGVSAGGRTGLTSVVTGLFFLAALVFSPLIAVIGTYAPATACALVIVGALMCKNARFIDWDDYSESIPAFLIAIGIPLTFSISDGLAIGFMAYPLIKIIAGKGKDISLLSYLIGAALAGYFLVKEFML